MKIICGVYKITSPDNKIYIGCSADIRERFYRYKGVGCKSQRKLYESIKLHGWDNHKTEVICECSREELDSKEKYYVDLYQTFNSEMGLNLQDGGGKTAKTCLETRKIMSISHIGLNTWAKGSKKSPEFKKRCSAMMSERQKKKIINVETNTIYSCISEAANSLGLKRSTLNMKLLNLNLNNTPMRYFKEAQKEPKDL